MDDDWRTHGTEKTFGEKPEAPRRGRPLKKKSQRGRWGEKPGKRIRKKKPSSVKTRTRQTNKKKLELLHQSDVIKASGGSSGHDDEFRRSNPSVPLKTLRRWRRPSNRAKSKLMASRKAKLSEMAVFRQQDWRNT